MATSMHSRDESSDSDEFPDILDPSSPKFDPRRALYAKSVKVPVSDAKQFNNLAEFENFLKGKDAKSLQLQKEKQPKEVLPGIIAERAAAQAREAVRKAAILIKNEGPSKRSATQERRSRSTTVLTRMEKYEKGPLSVLRRCVHERLKVVVVIRAAVAVRSHCRGYIVAFDKHMNMALMDVDEKFIRPLIKEKNSSSSQTSEMEQTLSSQTEHLTFDSHTKNQSKYRHPVENTSSLIKHDVTNTGEDERHRLASSKTSDLRDKLKQAADKKKHLDKHDRRDCLSDSDIRIKKETSDKLAKDRKTKSDLDEQTRSQSSDSDARERPKQVKREKQKKHFQPFWPLYQKWAENRCYTSYEIVDRHISQLFIRGDNIVSVAIAH